MKHKILKCSNLEKKFGSKQVLKNVSFEIDKGDILAFIGPNGAGKTTTIKLILGLQSITNGTVLINGYDVSKNFEKAILKVGSIVENPDFYMYLSGLDNLKLVANLYPDVDNKRINEVVELVGLEKRINDKVSKYSLGMRQRLGLACAILHKPNLLVLDEPTNGLDPEGIKDLRELLKKLAKEGMAIFVSSHNLLELESFCNKVCIIKNGEAITTTTLKELKKEKDNSNYLIHLDTTKGVKKILRNALIVDDEYIKLAVNKEKINEILKKLIDNNYLVYELKLEEVSLEEAFLSKTGGNTID